MSSPVEFFDVLYLGIFITLSRAFNPRFYNVGQPPQPLDDEIASAESHFMSLIHYFSAHFITVLDGVVIDPWYIVKRMLAEFAAAVVVFIQAFDQSERGDMDMDVDGLEKEGEEEDMLAPFKVKLAIYDIIGQSYPEVMHYYQHCVGNHHKHFVWTGPPVTILPRSEGIASILGVLISDGEHLDLPTCLIYMPDTTPLTTAPATPTTSAPSFPATATKRRRSIDANDLRAKKCIS